MPTTDERMTAPDAQETRAEVETQRRQRPLWKRIARVVSVLALVIALDVALSYALLVYGSHFQGMWEDYRAGTAAGDAYDTLCVGSSVALNALNPEPIDTILETDSFCIAGPGESPWASLRALRIALGEHPVQRVILGTSYNTLCEGVWTTNDLIYTLAESQGQSLPYKVTSYMALMTHPDYFGHIESLAMLAPFTLSHVKYTPTGVMNNIRNRLECANANEAGVRTLSTAVKLGKGYCNYQGIMDRTSFPQETLSAVSLRDATVNESKWGPLREAIELCEERGIELYVVIPPMPDFQSIAFGDEYPEVMGMLRDYVVDHGGTYLDFTMARTELLDLGAPDFLDGTHLNADGALRFSTVLSETIARIEAGEDVSGGFYGYDEWGDFRATIDRICLCWCDVEEGDGALGVEAFSLAGTDFPVEYELELGDRASDTWEVIGTWSQDGSWTIPVSGYHTVDLRLKARRAGTQDDGVVHYQSFTYHQP